jgi:hypothetical protein
MRLYAENEYDRSERVICEKCEVKMTPDGRFEIVATEKPVVVVGHDDDDDDDGEFLILFY